MKIAVVDLVSLDGGGYQITQSLFQYATAEQTNLHEWLFIVSKQDFESKQFVKVVKFPEGSDGYWKRAITEATKVERCLKKFGADIVISMPNMRIIGCSMNQAIYLQQSLPFQKEKKFSFIKKEERGYAFRQYIQGQFIKNSIRKAKMVFVQTEWMQKAVQKVCNGVPVVSIGYPEKDVEENPERTASAVSKDFFYPCGPAIYKNISVIVKAVNRLTQKGWKFKFYITLTQEEMLRLTNEKPIDERVFQYLGRISPEEVQKRYAKSTLVFASYIETVGLPLVEARETGTWIIASDCPFSHEVLDAYPNIDFFPYDDDKKLADNMEKVLLGSNTLVQRQHIEKKQDCCWNRMLQYLENEFGRE